MLNIERWRADAFCVPLLVLTTIFAASPGTADSPITPHSAFFGDLHVHTGNSIDAFAFGVLATPEHAYRFAKGEPIRHASGHTIRLNRPLDFIAVTDHAEYLGAFLAMGEDNNPLAQHPLAGEFYSQDPERFANGVNHLRNAVFSGQPLEELRTDSIRRSLWKRAAQTADDFYQPGRFTTLIGFEWSATPQSANLHRNVLFRGNSRQIPPIPFSAADSSEPEDLWKYLDAVRTRYGDVLAIPHNANLSDGKMFPASASGSGDLQLATRSANEPVAEISQIKGTSETHPLLSPDDEWARFELLEELMGASGRRGEIRGSYLRAALGEGLRFQQRVGNNPYRFGFVAGSDSHNASSPVEENNYSGKIGNADATAVARRDGGSITSQNILYSAAGLTGVWARTNTREGIFDALYERRVFATSGTRIELFLRTNGEKESVTMGDVLTTHNTPNFRFYARPDPLSAPLERVQVVKIWLDKNEGMREKVFDIACATGQPIAPDFRCPRPNWKIDHRNCLLDKTVSHRVLAGNWQDSEFAANEPAIYYLRALELPTCRWSTWDAIREGWPPSERVPITIQERAWSSPIWIVPTRRTDHDHRETDQ